MGSDLNSNIEIFYIENQDKLNLLNHFHNKHEIIYILEGSSTFHINNKKYICESGDVIFISNLESHEVRINEYPYKRFFMLINPKYLQATLKDPLLTSIFKHRPEHFTHVIKLNMEHKKNFTNLLEDIKLEFNSNLEYADEKISSYIKLLIIELFRNYKSAFPISPINKTTESVLKIQNYIEENYTEDINLQEISNEFYINMYYLSHQFKKVTGYSFKEYVILQRLIKAKELLFHSSKDITNIATECGFNSINHFIRIFKSYYEITPYQYRKKHFNNS